MSDGPINEPSHRRIVVLYVAGIVIGFAAGFVSALMLWGLSLVH